jgi:ATP-dependent Clp protease protease subunit
MPNQILKLLIDNKQAAAAGRRCEIVAAGKEATIYLYDAIVSTDAIAEWWGGVAAESLAKEIRELKVDTIHLRINSPGGDVFAGRAIQAALADHSAKVIAHIDGLAASAASFVILGADEIEMAEGAFIMIHKAWTLAMGNADDMKQVAELLDKIDLSIAGSYAKRTGKETDHLLDLMAKETWISAEEAIAEGFADRMAGEKTSEKVASWNLAAYSNAPKLEALEQPEEPKKKEPSPQAPEQQSEPELEAETLSQAKHDYLLRNLQVNTLTA